MKAVRLIGGSQARWYYPKDETEAAIAELVELLERWKWAGGATREELEELAAETDAAIAKHDKPAEPAPVIGMEAEAIASAQLAMDDEPAPHPWYGPCDAFGPDGECSECLGKVAHKDDDDEPAPEYRYLAKGEVIQEGDEWDACASFDDPPDWRPATAIGDHAPDPKYPAHRLYRRRVDEPAPYWCPGCNKTGDADWWSTHSCNETAPEQREES